MLGSFLEGAKATVRRAGAGDQAPVTDDPARDALKKSGAANVSASDRGRKVVGGVAPAASAVEGGDGAAAAGRDNDVGLSATESVSRSFSLLRASGARVMQPVKKALGADPEVVEARARLTKYKGSLSSAVAEAAATAATRREERDLLTKALAVQENDLRCWGYLSVLPCFREHRRLETNRAQLRVSMSERREEVISAKFQEVVRLLRSMPIIGPWTNKPQPSPEAEVDSLLAVGAGARDGGGGGGSGGAGGGGGGVASSGDGYGNGGDGGRYFFEDSFAVAPADLLAFDEKLALTRRRLRVCDRACAAAADAFAMKVVAAGGLEPRSTEDRAETLLTLVSRYHNLEVEEATADKDKGETCERKDRRGMREPATAGRRAAPAAGVGPQTGGSSSSVAAHLKQEEGGDGEDREHSSRRECRAAMTASDDGNDGLDDESGGGGGGGGGGGVSSSGGRGGRGEGGDRSPGGTGHATEDKEHRRPAEAQEGSTGAVLEGGGGDDASGDVGSGKVREGQSGGGEGAAARTAGGRFSRRSRKECEEAFFELMLDERNREGRLLRRFLTMAQAKKSPPSSSLASSSASSRTLSLSSSSSSSSAAAPRPGAHQKPSEAAGVASASSVGGSLAAAAAGAFSSLRWRVKGSGGSGGGGGGGGGGSAADNTPVVAREGGAPTAGVGKADIDAKAKIATNKNSYSGAAGSTRPGAAAAVTGNRPPQSSAGRAGVAEAGPGRMGHPARGDGRAREVKEVKEKEDGQEEEDWEGEGPVGPQVVKAFINYFSKEYLVNMFDVPEFMVPSLNELVALLVFRQARRLVFGYDKRRVMRKDLAWREKAEIVRSVPLLNLGAPPEYVPTPTAKSGAPRQEGDATAKASDAIGEGGRETEEAMVTLGSVLAAGSAAAHDSRGDDAVEAAVGAAAETTAVTTASGDKEAACTEAGEGMGEEGMEQEGEREDERLEEREERERHEEQEKEQQEEQEKEQEKEQEHGPANVVPDDSPRGPAALLANPGATVATASDPAATAASASAGSRPSPASDASVPAPGSPGVAGPPASAGSVGTDSIVRDLEPEPDSTPEARPPDAPECSDDVAVRATPSLSDQGGAASAPPSPQERATTPTEEEKGEQPGALRTGGSMTPAVGDSNERSEEGGEEGGRGSPGGREVADAKAGAETQVASREVAATAPDGKEGAPSAMPAPPPPSAGYLRASEAFGRLGDCATPGEMVEFVKSGMTLLSEDAARISGSDKPLDADTLLPLLVHALAHSSLPRVHEALNFIRNFRGPSWRGEQAYYVTCIEAAVSFVLEWTPGDGGVKNTKHDDQEGEGTSTGTSTGNSPSNNTSNKNSNSNENHHTGGPSKPRSTANAVVAPPYETPSSRVDAGGGSEGIRTATAATKRAAPQQDGWGGGGGTSGSEDAALAAKRAEQARAEEVEQLKRGQEALMRLGIFLEKHEVQEDTVDVLSSAGWM